MFSRVKEMFLYFSEAFSTFFGKLILSVLTCIIYYGSEFSTSLISRTGLDMITSDMNEFVDQKVDFVEAFSYDPSGTILLGIILVASWFLTTAIFEIFAFHACTTKGKTSDLNPFVKALKSKLGKLIKTNILKSVYILLGFMPMMICISVSEGMIGEMTKTSSDMLKLATGLLIIPPVFIILRYYSSSYFVLVKDCNAHEALRESKRITHGYKMPICILFFTVFLSIGLCTVALASFIKALPETGILTVSLSSVVAVLGYYTMYVFSKNRDKKS